MIPSRLNYRCIKSGVGYGGDRGVSSDRIRLQTFEHTFSTSFSLVHFNALSIMTIVSDQMSKFSVPCSIYHSLLAYAKIAMELPRNFKVAQNEVITSSE